jgi:fructose-1,6-bisphosphatase/inositol monophosphatase family enzyme
MQSQYTKELEVARGIALKAGEIMKKYFFAADQEVKRKEDGSPVTIADTTINSMVIQELQKNFDDGIIGEEESTADYGLGRRWLCDPIDGTKAFVWGVPTSMFSLGLVIDGVPQFGVIYDPYLDLFYWGAKGEGSYCSDQKLEVKKADLAGEHVAMTSSIGKIINEPQIAQKLLDKKVRLVTFSGAIYKACLIARGKLVGYFEGGIGAHDMAAVQVIVEEAGGKATAFNGTPLDYSKPFKGALVSNSIVHDQLVEILK